MTEKTTDSLINLYAQASAKQAPSAPPALSAAILMAVAQATQSSKAAEQVKPSHYLQTRVVSLLKHRVSGFTQSLGQLLTLPVLKYGLPVMLVGVVGLKMMTTEMPDGLDNARAPSAEEASATSEVPAVAPIAETTSIAASTPTPTPTPTPIAAPAMAKPTVAKQGSTQNNGKTISSVSSESTPIIVKADTPFENVPATEMSTKNATVGFRPEQATAPQAFPDSTEKTNATGLGQASKDSGGSAWGDLSNFGSNTTAKKTAEPEKLKRDLASDNFAQLPATSVRIPPPVIAAVPAPAPVAVAAAAPAPAPAPARVASSSSSVRLDVRPGLELKSSPTKEQRLRGLIVQSRELDGRLQELCASVPPKQEQVQALLALGANPAYVPNSTGLTLSTLALAQQCDFIEVVQLMQKVIKPERN